MHVTMNSRFKQVAKRAVDDYVDPWAEFELHAVEEERAQRIRFDAATRTWHDVDIVRIKAQRESFARGAMRECFRCKKMTTHVASSPRASRSLSWKRQKNYVLKQYIEGDLRAESLLRGDLMMQMDTKELADKFNVNIGAINDALYAATHAEGAPAQQQLRRRTGNRSFTGQLGVRPPNLSRMYTGAAAPSPTAAASPSASAAASPSRRRGTSSGFEVWSSALKKIDVLDAYLLRMIERPGQPLLWCEGFIDGPYQKHQNNAGTVLEVDCDVASPGTPESHRLRLTPHAFSHWTFEHTGGKTMVVDLQGVDDLYTDPQIHTAGGMHHHEYGVGNLGRAGQALFFMSHRCNLVCEKLALRRILPPRRSVDFSSSALVAPSARAGGDADAVRSRAAAQQKRSKSTLASEGALAAWLPSLDELAALEIAAGWREADWRAKRQQAHCAAEVALCRPCGSSSTDAILTLAVQEVHAHAALEHLKELEEAVYWKGEGWASTAARCRRCVMKALVQGGAPGVALCRGLCDWVRAAPRDATTFVSPFLGSSENLGWFDRWATILDEEIYNGRSGVWGVNAVGRRVSTAQRVAIGGALVFSTAAAAYCVWRWWRAKAAERRRRARDAGDK